MDKELFDTFKLQGRAFQAFTAYDDGMGEPWKEHDGHGPVSEWRRKGTKTPGEIILSEDRGYCRFYDFAAAVKLAKKDGWDTPPYKTGTAGERASRAAIADFERLRDWCNDRWHWVGVIVQCDGEQNSLWGIESDSPDYHKEVSRELAAEILYQAREAKRKADLKHCLVGCLCV